MCRPCIQQKGAGTPCYPHVPTAKVPNTPTFSDCLHVCRGINGKQKKNKKIKGERGKKKEEHNSENTLGTYTGEVLSTKYLRIPGPFNPLNSMLHDFQPISLERIQRQLFLACQGLPALLYILLCLHSMNTGPTINIALLVKNLSDFPNFCRLFRM